MKTAEEVIHKIEILYKQKNNAVSHVKEHSKYSYEQDTKAFKSAGKQQLDILELYAKERVVEFGKYIEHEGHKPPIPLLTYEEWYDKFNQ